MTKQLLYGILLLLSACTMACDKDDTSESSQQEPKPSFDITGWWERSYGHHYEELENNILAECWGCELFYFSPEGIVNRYTGGNFNGGKKYDDRLYVGSVPLPGFPCYYYVPKYDSHRYKVTGNRVIIYYPNSDAIYAEYIYKNGILDEAYYGEYEDLLSRLKVIQ